MDRCVSSGSIKKEKMKRGAFEHPTPSDAKKQKDDKVKDDESSLSELHPIQEKIRQLDKECAKEQIKVQHRFAAKLRPLFTQRRKVLQKIPNFWGNVIEKLLPSLTLCETDKKILTHLEDVDVEDNIDEQGSYKITLRFREDSSKYFTPPTLVKTVTFSEDDEAEPTSEATPITWTNGKNLVEETRSRRATADCDEDGEAFDEYSIFEWFTNEEEPDMLSIGDILRREVWQNPIIFLLDDEPEFDSDEDED